MQISPNDGGFLVEETCMRGTGAFTGLAYYWSYQEAGGPCISLGLVGAETINCEVADHLEPFKLWLKFELFLMVSVIIKNNLKGPSGAWRIGCQV